MNENEKIDPAIDASCRVPLLVLFGGAALWLVIGLALALTASFTFHMPWAFGDHAWLTYGRVQAAANNAILYGFVVPAALGVVLWIFARLSEADLALPLVPVIAAHVWHLGVLVGVAAIFMGDSTGFSWLEFPRGASVLLLAAYVLIAISAMATFGARRNRVLQPSHWFLLAALFWFPWIYATANIFLVAVPVRGVAQAVIDWWFTNNLIFVWLALVSLGISFYFLPKFAGRPLHNPSLTFLAFVTFILFGTWCGIPQGAPVPAWLPSASTVASLLLFLPLLTIVRVFAKSIANPATHCKGGPFCYLRFGTAAFIFSALMVISLGCPSFGLMAQYTEYGMAQMYLQVLGFAAVIICGAVYQLMPSVMAAEWPFPKFIRAQHWLFMLGVALLVIPLGIGGVVQGNNNYNFTSGIVFMQVSTMGFLLLLIGSLLFAANIIVLTIKWKFALMKAFLALLKRPLDMEEVKS
jgi:cytochrome c oxidase cbb3-type subunit 1